MESARRPRSRPPPRWHAPAPASAAAHHPSPRWPPRREVRRSLLAPFFVSLSLSLSQLCFVLFFLFHRRRGVGLPALFSMRGAAGRPPAAAATARRAIRGAAGRPTSALLWEGRGVGGLVRAVERGGPRVTRPVARGRVSVSAPVHTGRVVLASFFPLFILLLVYGRAGGGGLRRVC